MTSATQSLNNASVSAGPASTAPVMWEVVTSISWLLIFCINHPPLKECLQPWSGRASMTSIISWAEGRLRSIFDERFSFCLLLSSSLRHYWYSEMFSFFLVDQICLPAQRATLLWGVSPWEVLGLSNEHEDKKDIKWGMRTTTRYQMKHENSSYI